MNLSKCFLANRENVCPYEQALRVHWFNLNPFPESYMNDLFFFKTKNIYSLVLLDHPGIMSVETLNSSTSQFLGRVS